LTTCTADLNTRSELRLYWCAILGWNQSPSVASGAFADGADDLELRAFGEAPRMLAWPRSSSAAAPALTAQRHRIGHQDAPELMSRRGGCTCCLLCCERICERNAAQLPRWGEMRRDGWDGRLIVTCAFETREAIRDGDWLAHNPEVAGSNPVPATSGNDPRRRLRGLFSCPLDTYLDTLATFPS
jgi:hypothetical protein